LAADEGIDVGRCTQQAMDWLAKPLDDPDLAVDTRVSVPMYMYPDTRLWMTLGVRLARLQAAYVRQPSIRRQGDTGWRPVYDLEQADYMILVDEFAEVSLPGLHTFTREELRAICDRAKTREEILKACQERFMP
jgi:hypothetical protein